MPLSGLRGWNQTIINLIKESPLNLIKAIIDSSVHLLKALSVTYLRPRVPASSTAQKSKRATNQGTQPKTKDELLKSLWEEFEQIYFHAIRQNDFTRLDYVYFALLAKTRRLA
jgi:hypothetical protein